jgi:hypothetical protein
MASSTPRPVKSTRSRRPPLDNRRSWSQVFDDVFLEQANDTSEVLWRRVAAFGMAMSNGIGHAEFRRGELVELLGVKEPHRVYEAIATAKKRGAISNNSSSACLVIPEHRQRRGNQATECRTHGLYA